MFKNRILFYKHQASDHDEMLVVFCRLRGPKLLMAGGRSGKKGRQSLQLGVNSVAASRKELYSQLTA